jgi:secreted trypsin-like serine protease
VGSTGVAQTYPYFVWIDSNYYPWCEGSLVAPDVILMAAHCQPDIDRNMTVMINGYHSSLKLNKDQEYRQVEYMLPNREYDSSTFYNDIMLLKLSGPVTSVPWVKLN